MGYFFLQTQAITNKTKKLQSYVSNGALKLENAFIEQPVFIKDAVCLDCGASTGGFTDVLLRLGARLVYAIDIGKNQLHCILRSNKRVSSFEGKNVLTASHPLLYNSKSDIVVIDLSFVSIIPTLFLLSKFLNPGTVAFVLVKPQFETSPNFINKYGIVNNEKAQFTLKTKILNAANFFGFRVIRSIKCPIFKKKGNLEFILCLLKQNQN